MILSDQKILPQVQQQQLQQPYCIITIENLQTN